jgi:DNA-binding NarL/FixJ family response regulator
MKRIIINERCPLLVDTLYHILLHEHRDCTCIIATDTDALLTSLSVTRADFLLLDGSGDDRDLAGLCTRLFQIQPDLKILIYSNTFNSLETRRLLNAGIRGFLLKTATRQEFINAVYEVYNGEYYIHAPIQKMLIFSSPTERAIHKELTKREKEILQLIVNEFTTKEIAQKLYVSHCTIETHRLNIIQKLGVKNTAGLVREAIYMDIYQPTTVN